MVELTVNLRDEQVSFVIQDQGTGFNQDDLPDPTSPENIENPGGRNIPHETSS